MAPPGTSNHILWHAGHALWVQDALCVEPLTGASELPAGWEHSFGADCRPVRETQHWPERGEVLRLLERQLVRLQELFRERAEQLTDSALAAQIVHGLHDEARHQGEMFLLLKLRRGKAASSYQLARKNFQGRLAQASQRNIFARKAPALGSIWRQTHSSLHLPSTNIR